MWFVYLDFQSVVTCIYDHSDLPVVGIEMYAKMAVQFPCEKGISLVGHFKTKYLILMNMGLFVINQSPIVLSSFKSQYHKLIEAEWRLYASVI